MSDLIMPSNNINVSSFIPQSSVVMTYSDRLMRLERESIQLLRSIPQISLNPAMLWSTGKDSTLILHLIKKAFGSFPWPVVHIDTGKKPQEIYKFRDDMAIRWGMPLKIIKNEMAMQVGISPDNVSHYECCTQLKTNALKFAIADNKWDALILSIRHDEHYVRGMEDLISLRDEDGNWQYTSNFGGFGLRAPEQVGYSHIRVHPLLSWAEADVWEYTMVNRLPVNPLYFSKDGKRMRSIGCEPCTECIESKAQTVTEIYQEVYANPNIERMGRAQDKESEETMLILRKYGYC